MNSRNVQNLRLLPAVDSVLNTTEVVELCNLHGRIVVVRWLREILEDLRIDPSGDLPANRAAIMTNIVRRLEEAARLDALHRLRRVINGTGVVVHTNLGRAPLAIAAVQAIAETAACNNLEVDLPTVEESFEKVYAVATRIREMRDKAKAEGVEVFQCPEGENGCYSCRLFEKILKGEAEYIGEGEMRQDLYMV